MLYDLASFIFYFQTKVLDCNADERHSTPSKLDLAYFEYGYFVLTDFLLPSNSRAS
jgi:hypothetical protein